MKVKCFTFNPFQENTYILYDNTNECVIIDPGCSNANEQVELINFIKSNTLAPVKLINTHAHIDHIFGNKFISRLFKIDLYLHKLELELLKEAENIAKSYGIENFESSPLPNYFMNEGDIISFGNTSLEVLFTPGHSPGHICLYNKKNNILIAGDVIFKLSIGRTDLPGGNYDTLISSIKNKLYSLPTNTEIFCGHGPTTNINFEKLNNPFLKD
tara:strand:+ start:685 stop:1326 length:642 start_codon:yes stop_codon:yes gene_type:complete